MMQDELGVCRVVCDPLFLLAEKTIKVGNMLLAMCPTCGASMAKWVRRNGKESNSNRGHVA
jgi:hypothetical protein